MYNEVFDEIVDIIHNDYAGCRDKQGWDQPENYYHRITEEERNHTMTDEEFVSIVQDYLLDLKDLHLGFTLAKGSDTKPLTVGFSVRRYKDRLYVISTDQENRLNVGDSIISLDGFSILEIVNKHRRRLMAEQAEREKWDTLLTQFGTAKFVDQTGKIHSIELKTYEKIGQNPEYTMNHLGEDTLILKMSDFLNADAILSLVTQYENELAKKKNLIIDVRVNHGGMDNVYSPLLPYLFKDDIVDLSDDETMLTNCTERNVDQRIVTLQDMMAGIEDQKTKDDIQVFINELEKHRGEGFVELDLSEIADDTKLKTKPGPDSVIVMTDVHCGSSGDSFIETCKRSSKITVVGRSTAGLNDYSNVAIRKLMGRFEFIYPTSRVSAIDEGKGMTGVGVQPDVYVPWTPKHLAEDVDMNEALKLLNER